MIVGRYNQTRTIYGLVRSVSSLGLVLVRAGEEERRKSGKTGGEGGYIYTIWGGGLGVW